jgi:hypothetical protein
MTLKLYQGCKILMAWIDVALIWNTAFYNMTIVTAVEPSEEGNNTLTLMKIAIATPQLRTVM